MCFIPSFLKSCPIPYSNFLPLFCQVGLRISSGTWEAYKNSQVQTLVACPLAILHSVISAEFLMHCEPWLCAQGLS